ncbi:hypothetical protein RKD55_001968 [Rossellomorea marisflavi]
MKKKVYYYSYLFHKLGMIEEEQWKKAGKSRFPLQK